MPYAQSGQSEIWWDSNGDGTPIVLINGLSSPCSVWFRLVPMLASRHRVLVFDNLGTGRTRTSSDPFDMTMLADAAVSVLDAAGESSAHVLGMSMGGLIAQQLTLRRPDRVKSLALVSTHAGGPHMTQDQDSIAILQQAQTLAPEERTNLLSDLTYAHASRSERDADLAVRAQYPTSEDGYRRQMAATVSWERLSDLHTIECPTLVLHGAQDQLVSVDNARQVASIIPAAELTILEECGHQIFTDQPINGALTVLQFLDEAASIRNT